LHQSKRSGTSVVGQYVTESVHLHISYATVQCTNCYVQTHLDSLYIQSEKQKLVFKKTLLWTEVFAESIVNAGPDCADQSIVLFSNES
jgi:NAD-dependent SIR2 family protein deacetylase